MRTRSVSEGERFNESAKILRAVSTAGGDAKVEEASALANASGSYPITVRRVSFEVSLFWRYRAARDQPRTKQRNFKKP